MLLADRTGAHGLEFAAISREMPTSTPPPLPTPAPSGSIPFKVAEQWGSLRKKLPGLKKEAGQRIGSVREKISGLKRDDLIARIRHVGKFLFGAVCWVLIEGWAVCVATKDQTVRLAAYSITRLRAWRAGKRDDTRYTLWPRDRTGWRRIIVGYGTLLVLLGILLCGGSSLSTPGRSKLSDAQRKASRLLTAAALADAPKVVKANDRASVYCAIANAQATAGDCDGACASVNEAKKALARIGDEGQRTSIYRFIVMAQAMTGDVSGAKETAAKCDHKEKEYAYYNIVEAQASAGNIAGATATAAEIGNETSAKSTAYQYIAETQAKAGDIAGAKATARFIAGSYWAAAYQAIAQAQAKAGDVAAAKATAETIDNDGCRFNAYRDIAIAQIAAGDVAGGIATIEKYGEHLALAYEDLAVAQAEAGDITGATSMAMRITNLKQRADVYRRIANCAGKSGECDRLHYDRHTNLQNGLPGRGLPRHVRVCRRCASYGRRRSWW